MSKAEDAIKSNLQELKDDGIEYDYRLFGSKRLAKIELEGGGCILYCPATKKVKYKNFKSKKPVLRLSKWIEANKLVLKK